ncbi:MAG TPA: O-antigen ligase family protein [Candidatus Eisenbacteria bacterium]|nr:O-antigen ligase family protein [Candidatus Eisenbacteria bacterium]
MSDGLSALRQRSVPRPEHLTVIGVVAAELALLALGFLVGRPLLAAAAAAAVAYFLIAFRSPDVAWALVWVTVPPNVEILFGGGFALTIPTEPMIALALLAWCLRQIMEGRWSLPASPLHLPLAVLAGLALLSTVWSVSPASTLKAWIMMAGYVAFGYVYYLQAPCDRHWRERALLLVAITGAVWGAFGIVRVLFSGLEAVSVASTYSYGAFRPFFREHGTYGAYLGMLLPAAMLAALERKGRERLLYGSCAFLIGAGVLLAFARAGWLALLLVLPMTLFAWTRWRKAARRLVLPATLVLAVVLLVGGIGISRQVARHATSVVSRENLSNLERLNRWNTALTMVRDRPWTGVGYGSYLDAYPEYRSKALVTDQTYIRMGVHSEPLKILSEMGVPGLLTALWFLAIVAWVALRAFRSLPNPDERILALAALAGLGTYLINGLFNAYLVEDKVTVPFWVAIGVIGALDGRREKSVP